jgi:hypothetical protein
MLIMPVSMLYFSYFLVHVKKTFDRSEDKLVRKNLLCEPNHWERARESDPVTKNQKSKGNRASTLMTKTNP